jgi:hypothetical protein
MSPLKTGIHVRHSETKEVSRQKKCRNVRRRLLLMYLYDVQTKEPKVDFPYIKKKVHHYNTGAHPKSPY